MNPFYKRFSPAHLFLGLAMLGLALSLLSLLVALAQPHIDIPKNAVPVQIGDIEIIPSDLIEEPDQLGSYAAIEAFRDRQTDIRAQLDQSQISATYMNAQGAQVAGTFDIRPRGLSDLPWTFWFQIAVGMISYLIGIWVLSLRPDDWGARMFSLTAFFLVFSTHSAAIYSTRQVALDGALFATLSNINAFGAMTFGIALVGLFSQYPRSLFRPIWLLIPTVIFGAGIVGNTFHIGPDNLIGITTLSELLVALLLGAVQWYLSRREPLNRAGLRWFILVSLLGCSLFIFLSMAPTTLGLTETALVSQGIAFSFFNIMHVGLALGVMRYKVFNLDRWSYYIWLWLSGMVMIILLDILLIRFLQWQPWFSLGAALLISGFLYFPLRQMLLRFLLHSRSATLKGRMPEIVGAALSQTHAESEKRWDALLSNVFAPLAPPEEADRPVTTPMIDENGLALLLPGLDGIAPRRLRYALNGRRLFSPDDTEVASNMVQTYMLAAESRRAYERGVNLERDRISRDVHDNIGAQLLSALHSREVSRKDDLLRDSLSDLRSIINDGFQSDFGLLPLLADLRQETAQRLEAKGIALNWIDPVNDAAAEGPIISFALVNGLRSMLREVVSNVLRHSQARTLWVTITQTDMVLTLDIQDDGKGIDPEQQNQDGNGLANIHERADALLGKCTIRARADGQSGTWIEIILPLHAQTPRDGQNQ